MPKHPKHPVHRTRSSSSLLPYFVVGGAGAGGLVLLGLWFWTRPRSASPVASPPSPSPQPDPAPAAPVPGPVAAAAPPPAAEGPPAEAPPPAASAPPPPTLGADGTLVEAVPVGSANGPVYLLKTTGGVQQASWIPDPDTAASVTRNPNWRQLVQQVTPAQLAQIPQGPVIPSVSGTTPSAPPYATASATTQTTPGNGPPSDLPPDLRAYLASQQAQITDLEQQQTVQLIQTGSAIPGYKDAVPILLAAIKTDPARLQAEMLNFQLALAACASLWADQKVIAQADAKTMQDQLAGFKLADQLAQAASAVPVVGQLIKGIMSALDPLAGANWFGNPQLEGSYADFTGWRWGCAWFCNVPILGPCVPILIHKITTLSQQNGNPVTIPALQLYPDEAAGLVKLMQALPFGPSLDNSVVPPAGYHVVNHIDPARIANVPGAPAMIPGSVWCKGTAWQSAPGNDPRALPHCLYDYWFQVGGRSFEVSVANPLDITSSGPRGFNPGNPNGWNAHYAVPGFAAPQGVNVLDWKG